SRCDSAAMVLNTRLDLPEPESPVKTVRRRLARSISMFLRLLTCAPRTRIVSWASAWCMSSLLVWKRSDVSVPLVVHECTVVCLEVGRDLFPGNRSEVDTVRRRVGSTHSRTPHMKCGATSENRSPDPRLPTSP